MTTSPYPSVTDEMLAEIEREADAATPGPWYWGGTPVSTSDEALDICRENIQLTEKPDPYFCEVFVEDGRRTALVGNGPTGQQNAAYIARANPATIKALLAHIADLKQQLVAAGVTAENCEVFRRDAERYRWLREQDWFSGDLCVLRDPKKVLTSRSGLGADCPSRDRLDAAIDAARQS